MNAPKSHNYEAFAQAVAQWKAPTEPQHDPAFDRQTDLLLALQAYAKTGTLADGPTGTEKLQLVADLKAALIQQFGPVAGRTIAQMAGE